MLYANPLRRVLKRSAARIFFALALVCCGSCHSNDWAHEEGVSFDKNKVYLITRTTNSKPSAIAKFFNIKDTISSHIGIGIVRNGTIRIYHVIDARPKDKTDLQVHSLQEFLGMHPETPEVSYFSIWESKSEVPSAQLLESLKELSKRSIVFDYEFDLNNQKFYCSELCAYILNTAAEFDFQPRRKSLNGFFKDVLKRETLEYFPVDFFLEDSKFVKIYEEETTR